MMTVSQIRKCLNKIDAVFVKVVLNPDNMGWTEISKKETLFLIGFIEDNIDVNATITNNNLYIG